MSLFTYPLGTRECVPLRWLLEDGIIIWRVIIERNKVVFLSRWADWNRQFIKKTVTLFTLHLVVKGISMRNLLCWLLGPQPETYEHINHQNELYTLT